MDLALQGVNSRAAWVAVNQVSQSTWRRGFTSRVPSGRGTISAMKGSELVVPLGISKQGGLSRSLKCRPTFHRSHGSLNGRPTNSNTSRSLATVCVSTPNPPAREKPES